MQAKNRLVSFVAALAFAILTAGCMMDQQGGGAGPPPDATQGGRVADLTNQQSPKAAGYQSGRSVTRLGSSESPAIPPVRLELIAEGLAAPMMLTHAGDGSGRLFVVDQIGVVRIVDPNGTLVSEPFLDVRDRMIDLSPSYDERGLLSIAFHPDFETNGRVFAFYSAPLRNGAPARYDHTNRLSEFSVSPGDPYRVDMASERILLEIDLPYPNHNGGQIVFSPEDGYLYVPTGDGGGSDDNGFGHTPDLGNAQDLTTLLGKVLRIDVDDVGPDRAYAIPPDNPYAGASPILPEIFAYGLRNPAYLAFDSGGDHLLYTASAGQELFESVYLVVKGGNYGWNIREGSHCFSSGRSSGPPAEICPTTGRNGEPIIGPIVEGGHDLGNTIVGGCIYRGTSIPALAGVYIFGYWSTSFRTADGSLLAASPPGSWKSSLVPGSAAGMTPAANEMWDVRVVGIAGNPSGRPGFYIRGVGEDDRHELYVATSTASGPGSEGTSGQVWRLVPA